MTSDLAGQRAPEPPPAAPNRSENPLLAVTRILVLIAGLGIAALGLSCSAFTLLGVLLGQLSGEQEAAVAVQSVTLSAGFVVLASGLGLALAWHAWRAIQGRPSAPFHPPAVWPLILLFLLALGAGQVVLSLDLLPALTFPIAHILVAVIPPLTIVALVGRAVAGAVRWRSVTVQLAGGAFLSTAIAFSLEIALLVGLFVGAMVAVAVQPGGDRVLMDLADSLSTLQLQDPNALFDLLNLPLVAAGAFVVVAVVVPVLEELVKTAGVGLMAYRRPTQAQAMLWGVAAGAGFAIVEGLFNTLNSLDAWALVVVLRSGATLLHCLTGGLMGLAWHHVLSRRWLPATGLYAGSVALHAAWNGLSAGMALVSFDTGGGGNVTPEVLSAGAVSAAILVLLVGLAGGMAAALAWLTRRVDGAVA